MDRTKEFEPIFYPQSMAVVGVSADTEKPGYRFLKAMLDFGFKGRLYPVNPREEEILGLKAYPSVMDIPVPVDFVNISAPAKFVPAIIRDCIAKGVPAAEVFTAGFSEVGEEGRRLELEIAALARGKLRLIGPNCFGVYCPGGGLTLLPGGKYPKESGNVGLISQSGGLATDFIWAATGHGIKFSKVISYGNACDLNEVDFLEYLAADPETKVIAAYLEGIKDGGRFVKLARDLLGKKPLIIWKSGLTETGGRAVNSHTGSLAGDKGIWQAFFRQTGAVPADGLEELIDTTAIFSHLPNGAGRRVGVVGGGGGIGVAASDICERVGLRVPASSPEVLEQLRALLPPTGTSLRNPVDIGAPMADPAILRKVIGILLSWDEVDTLVVDRIFFYGIRQLVGTPDTENEKRVETLINARNGSRKPVMAVLGELALQPDVIDMEEARRKVYQRFLQAGVFVLPSLQRMARALFNMASYYERVRAGGRGSATN